MTVIGITASRKSKATRYWRVVEMAGGSPLILRPQHNTRPNAVLGRVDGLVFGGGEDIDPFYYNEPHNGASPDTERDDFEIPLMRAALERDVPIFGICRGMEVLNVVMGGKLIRWIEGHRSSKNGESMYHKVFIAPGSRLGAILGGSPIIQVNSRHHQGFNQARKAPGLTASAYVLEGDLIEAVEVLDRSWVLGVQWHPERIRENHPKNMNLFYSLVEAAERYSARERVF